MNYCRVRFAAENRLKLATIFHMAATQTSIFWLSAKTTNAESGQELAFAGQGATKTLADG
jgi:hypothetical protein